MNHENAHVKAAKLTLEQEKERTLQENVKLEVAKLTLEQEKERTQQEVAKLEIKRMEQSRNTSSMTVTRAQNWSELERKECVRVSELHELSLEPMRALHFECPKFLPALNELTESHREEDMQKVFSSTMVPLWQAEDRKLIDTILVALMP